MPPWISTRFVCRFLTRIQENKFGPPVIHAKVTFMDCFCYLDIKIRDLKDSGSCNQQSQSGLGMLTMKPKPDASVSLLVGSFLHGASSCLLNRFRGLLSSFLAGRRTLTAWNFPSLLEISLVTFPIFRTPCGKSSFESINLDEFWKLYF